MESSSLSITNNNNNLYYNQTKAQTQIQKCRDSLLILTSNRCNSSHNTSRRHRILRHRGGLSHHHRHHQRSQSIVPSQRRRMWQRGGLFPYHLMTCRIIHLWRRIHILHSGDRRMQLVLYKEEREVEVCIIFVPDSMVYIV